MRMIFRAVSLCAASAVVALGLPAVAAAVPHSGARGLSSHRVCATASAGVASCDARLVTTSQGASFNAKPSATSSVAGYHPSDLLSAYNLASSDGRQRADRGHCRCLQRPPRRLRTWPHTAVSSAFRPRPSARCPPARWSAPEVHASPRSGRRAAPRACRGATAVGRRRSRWTSTWSRRSASTATSCSSRRPRSSLANLGTAVNEAGQARRDRDLQQLRRRRVQRRHLLRQPRTTTTPGIAMTASSGDGGYGVEYPAASQYVTAVGGTSLTATASTPRGWTETAWSGAGSGCSADDAAAVMAEANPLIAGRLRAARRRRRVSGGRPATPV